MRTSKANRKIKGYLSYNRAFDVMLGYLTTVNLTRIVPTIWFPIPNKPTLLCSLIIDKLHPHSVGSKVAIHVLQTLYNGSVLLVTLIKIYFICRLYWTDEELQKIHSSNLDGSSHAPFVDSELGKPVGITIFGPNVYWFDQTVSILIAKK